MHPAPNREDSHDANLQCNDGSSDEADREELAEVRSFFCRDWRLQDLAEAHV